MCEGMTYQMREDVKDAEIEPQPAPADVFMSQQAKVKVRMRPIKIAKKETKWSVPRNLLKKKSLRVQHHHVSPLRKPGKRK